MLNTMSPLTYGGSSEAPEDIESSLTALHFSALNAYSQMNTFLMQHTADPNARSHFGDPRLHVAIRSKLLGRECHNAWTSGKYAITAFTSSINAPTTAKAGPESR